MVSGDLADFGNGLNAPDLIVCVHNGNQHGTRSDSLQYVVRIHDSVFVHRHSRDFHALFFQRLYRVHDGKVFHLGRNQMVTAGPACVDNPFQGAIVRLGPSGGKDNLLCLGVNESGYFVPGLVQYFGYFLAEAVHAGGFPNFSVKTASWLAPPPARVEKRQRGPCL